MEAVRRRAAEGRGPGGRGPSRGPEGRRDGAPPAALAWLAHRACTGTGGLTGQPALLRRAQTTLGNRAVRRLLGAPAGAGLQRQVTYNVAPTVPDPRVPAYIDALDAVIYRAYLYVLHVPTLGPYATIDGHTEYWTELWEEHQMGQSSGLLAGRPSATPWKRSPRPCTCRRPGGAEHRAAGPARGHAPGRDSQTGRQGRGLAGHHRHIQRGAHLGQGGLGRARRAHRGAHVRVDGAGTLQSHEGLQRRRRPAAVQKARLLGEGAAAHPAQGMAQAGRQVQAAAQGRRSGEPRSAAEGGHPQTPEAALRRGRRRSDSRQRALRHGGQSQDERPVRLREPGPRGELPDPARPQPAHDRDSR